MDKTRTVVKICGKEYMMAGFESEEYIHKVAICVDRKMMELKHQYVNLNSGTLAVLTAINVADDLMKLQEQADALILENQKLKEEIKRLKETSPDGGSPRSNVSTIKKERSQIFDSYK